MPTLVLPLDFPAFLASPTSVQTETGLREGIWPPDLGALGFRIGLDWGGGSEVDCAKVGLGNGNREGRVDWAYRFLEEPGGGVCVSDSLNLPSCK